MPIRSISCRLLALLCLALTTAADGAASDPVPTGRLQIAGDHVISLTLKRPGGAEVRLDNPAKEITLAAGQYDVYEIVLQGRFISRPYLDTSPEPVTIEPNAPTVLPIGSPLRQLITAERQGRVLYMRYRILDISGNVYRPTIVGPDPVFEVYRGKRKIGSGPFQQADDGTFSSLWRVPLTAAGPMRIIAKNDSLADLAPPEGEPTTVPWSFAIGMLSLLLWLVVIAAAAISKSNYRLQAAAVAAPLLVILVLWTLLRWLLPFDAASEEAITVLVNSLVAGLTILCLSADRLTDLGPVLRSVAAVAVVSFTGALAVISAAMGLTSEALMAWVMVTTFALIMVAGFIAAAFACREEFSPLRFGLSLAAGSLAASVILMLAWIPLALLTSQKWTIGAVFAGAILFTITALLINLPFLITAACTPLYRQRLADYLQIEDLA